jgi:hypothetical protein
MTGVELAGVRQTAPALTRLWREGNGSRWPGPTVGRAFRGLPDLSRIESVSTRTCRRRRADRGGRVRDEVKSSRWQGSRGLRPIVPTA